MTTRIANSRQKGIGDRPGERIFAQVDLMQVLRCTKIGQFSSEASEIALAIQMQYAKRYDFLQFVWNFTAHAICRQAIERQVIL